MFKPLVEEDNKIEKLELKKTLIKLNKFIGFYSSYKLKFFTIKEDISVIDFTSIKNNVIMHNLKFINFLINTRSDFNKDFIIDQRICAKPEHVLIKITKVIQKYFTCFLTLSFLYNFSIFTTTIFKTNTKILKQIYWTQLLSKFYLKKASSTRLNKLTTISVKNSFKYFVNFKFAAFNIYLYRIVLVNFLLYVSQYKLLLTNNFSLLHHYTTRTREERLRPPFIHEVSKDHFERRTSLSSFLLVIESKNSFDTLVRLVKLFSYNFTYFNIDSNVNISIQKKLFS